MTEQLGDGPVQAAYAQDMEAVARAIDVVFNGEDRHEDRKVGFILMVFPFGSQDGRCNYISNGADRKDVARLLHEQAKRFDEMA